MLFRSPDALEVAEPLPPTEPGGLPGRARRGGSGRRPGARPAGYGKRPGVSRHHLRHALHRGHPPALPGDPHGAGGGFGALPLVLPEGVSEAEAARLSGSDAGPARCGVQRHPVPHCILMKKLYFLKIKIS